MSDSDDIVGLTFSEFAFFVAFILILMLVVGRESSAALRAQVIELTKQLADAKTKLTEKEEALTRLEQELAKRPPPSLRSRQRPSCMEKKIASGFLFRVTIVGPDRYTIDPTGTDVTLPELMQTYSAEIERAIQADCVHSVEVGYSQNISLPDYDRALKLLEQQFYPRRLAW
jgi:hypothetical protein